VGAASDSDATEVKRDVTAGQSETRACWCGRPHEQGEVRMDPDEVRAGLGLEPLDVPRGIRRKPPLNPEDQAKDDARRAKVEALWEAAGGRPVRLSRAEWLAAYPPGPSKAERVRRATKRHDEATRRW